MPTLSGPVAGEPSTSAGSVPWSSLNKSRVAGGTGERARVRRRRYLETCLFGHHLDLAIVATADALGRDSILGVEREVDDTPFGGGHWLKRDHVSGLADLGRDVESHVDERALSPAAVSLDIDGENRLFIAVVGDEDVQQVLKGVEGFSTAADQYRQFVRGLVGVPVDIEDLCDQPDAVARRLRVARADARLSETEQQQQIAQGAAEEVDRVLGVALDLSGRVAGRPWDGDLIFRVCRADRGVVARTAARTATTARPSLAGLALWGAAATATARPSGPLRGCWLRTGALPAGRTVRRLALGPGRLGARLAVSAPLRRRRRRVPCRPPAASADGSLTVTRTVAGSRPMPRNPALASRITSTSTSSRVRPSSASACSTASSTLRPLVSVAFMGLLRFNAVGWRVG